MTIGFEKPERSTDWTTVALETLSALIKGWSVATATAAAPAALKAIPGVYSNYTKLSAALKGSESRSPENLAWKWLYLTLADATAIFLDRLRKSTVLNGEELEDAVKDFLNLAMKLPPETHFEARTLSHLATHAASQPARANLPHLISKATRSTTWDEARWRCTFEECLAIASVSVVAAFHDEFQGLIMAVSGPSSEGLKRDIAWARHNLWITEKFDCTPVFSPDGSVTTPVSKLYLRLRCYWHTERKEETGNDQREVKTWWTAYLADLHETVEAWLQEEVAPHPICVIAGGPGSGKSTFAKALAAEVAQTGKHRVIFFELQRMHFTGNLYADIGTYLTHRNRATGDQGSAGFELNPLDWLKDDHRPVLLVFDGLDEITHDETRAQEVARHFILNAKQLVDQLHSDGCKARAVILGRNLACQEGRKAAGLPLEVMLNVAPIRSLKEADLKPHVQDENSSVEHRTDYPEISEHLARDQRPEYWAMWARSQGKAVKPVPDAIIHDNLSDLNVEPLLLHLLILSDYCGEKSEEAAANRNLVYLDILGQVHERNRKKAHQASAFEKEDFFLLMECLGLAAWRGNSRTGDEETYRAVREIHAHRLKLRFPNFQGADLDSMILQTHARRVEGDKPGFEFIHRSFGEYLAACGLLSLAVRTGHRMTNKDDPQPPEKVSQDWIAIIREAELTPEVIRFLKDEARLRREAESLSETKISLEKLATWVNRKGMPYMNAGPTTYRELETIQRCAESALLATGTAITAALVEQDGGSDEVFEIDWDESRPITMIHRLRVTEGWPVRLALHNLHLEGVNLPGCQLNGADLSKANLRGANFIGASFNRATFVGAALAGAKLVGTNCFETDFMGADLNGADLNGVNLLGAKLDSADLRDAQLIGANVFSTTFVKANLQGANLQGANFSEVNFSGADLSGAILDYAVLGGIDLAKCTLASASVKGVDFSKTKNFTTSFANSVFGVRQGVGLTKLPDGFAYPDFWHVAEDAKNESQKFGRAYLEAYLAWRNQRAQE